MSWNSIPKVPLVALIACLLLGLLGDVVLAQERRVVTGRVVDADSGQPLRGVEVRVATRAPVHTDADGRFSLVVPSATRVVLNVSTIGYALARRTVNENEAGSDLLIPLVAGTGTYTERVSVSAKGGEAATPGVSVRALESRELQDLGGVLVGDPLRAAQTLPGVSWNDDYRAELSIRGHGPDHIGFSIDDVPTTWLAHTLIGRGTEGGSISLVNADVLERLTLTSGPRPQRLGDRAGAWLDLTLREGSRDAVNVRGSLGLAGASTVVEGPLGRSRRGSWLVSARQSYLDWLLDHIPTGRTQTPVFGFTDTQNKVAFDLTPNHRLKATIIAGRSRLDSKDDTLGPNSLSEGFLRTGLATVGLESTLAPSVLLSQRVWTTTQRFENVGLLGQKLSSGSVRDTGYRADVAWSPAGPLLVEAGGSAAYRTDATTLRQFANVDAELVQLLASPLSGHGLSSAGYAQTTWRGWPRLGLTAGLRVTRLGFLDDTVASPWALAAWTLRPGTVLRTGVGVAHQSPSIEHVSGLSGNADARSQRARHVDVGLEQTWRAWRAEAALFDRRDTDFFRQTDGDTRLVDGEIILRDLTGQFENALRGATRGVDLTLTRRSAQGCGGWASYTFARSRVTDRLTGETFWADWDQRHSLTGYAHCQVSRKMRVSGRIRLGTGFPIPAYLHQTGELTWQVAGTRNEARVPDYARLDLMVSRAFALPRQRLTLFAEAMNVTGHRNYRATTGAIRMPSGLGVRFVEEMLPFLPVAGLQVEF